MMKEKETIFRKLNFVFVAPYIIILLFLIITFMIINRKSSTSETGVVIRDLCDLRDNFAGNVFFNSSKSYI